MASNQVASDSSQSNAKLKEVADADIEEKGRFKYILIKVHDKDVDDDFKYIVRGTAEAAYHGDIYDMYVNGIESTGLDCEVKGGGRIQWLTEKKIKIFGYSQGYGRAEHRITQSILQKRYPDCEVIWSNDGY